jgi:YVTN family beta-propeller protein
VALTPDGHHTYVVNTALGDMSVIDTRTDAVVARDELPTLPAVIALAPRARRPDKPSSSANHCLGPDTAAGSRRIHPPSGAVREVDGAVQVYAPAQDDACTESTACPPTGDDPSDDHAGRKRIQPS